MILKDFIDWTAIKYELLQNLATLDRCNYGPEMVAANQTSRILSKGEPTKFRKQEPSQQMVSSPLLELRTFGIR